jgi:hypothetical protein
MERILKVVAVLRIDAASSECLSNIDVVRELEPAVKDLGLGAMGTGSG